MQTWHDFTHSLLTSHFVWGLVVAFLICLALWLSGAKKRHELRREVRKLRDYLNTQMEITAKGNETLKKEAAALRQHNENLRVTVKEWQQRPGRNELRTLLIYDKAVRILHQTAPGFSPIWEKAVHEAEQEIVASESGVSGLIRRALRPFSQSREQLPPSQSGSSSTL